MTAFRGGYRGATWNAQGFLAFDLDKQHQKRVYLHRLLGQHDWVALQETHSTLGTAAAIQIPEGFTPFWSHGSRHQAGVALLVRSTFLANFRKVPSTDWVEPEPGRLAVLHLDGPQGALSIATVYFHSGHFASDRQDLRLKLHRLMAQRPASLWVITGDFNWVTKEEDRIGLTSQLFSGHHDAAEEVHWQDQVAGPAELRELSQPLFTFQSEGARSRLDRVYTTNHTADFFGGTFWCTALPWPLPDASGWAVSDHRPVSFGHRCPATADRPPLLRDTHIRHPDFGKRVARAYHEMVREHLRCGRPPDAMQRLSMTKQSMRAVATTMDETRFGATYLDAHTIPETAATAFALIAAVRSGTIPSIHVLQQRLPPAWMPSLTRSVANLEMCLRRLKDKAIELTRAEVLNDMRVQQEEDYQGDVAPDEHTRRIKKNTIGRRLAMLARRTANTGIHHLIDSTGDIHTDEDKIAEHLAAHWRHVFRHQPVDEEQLRRWTAMAARAGAPHLSAPRAAWRLRTKDIAKALRIAGNSRPGPDGIPFQAWRALGPLGLHILWEAGRALEMGLHTGDPAHDLFNESLLCCLPKKASRTASDGEGIYEAGETRPLSITNTDNRLIANAYRLRWEPVLAPHIASEQRGFVPGRSMLANIADIEHSAMLASLECRDAVIVLFDFSAAFPSISRTYLFAMARAAGFPDFAMHVLGALYHQTVGQLLLHGRLHEHVRLEAGIRQGCPLSPILFALASDSLLRIIGVRHPAATTRAFADDTAMVLRSWSAERRCVFATFRAFESVSNLSLNLSKTVVIPLWQADLHRLQAATASSPSEPQITWVLTGKYLGFWIGPGKGRQSWEKPLAKFHSRLRDWQWSEMGLHAAIGTYNTYVLPVLLFVAQLEPPPTTVIQAEKAALRRIAPGPGNWCSPADLHHGHAYGLGAEMRPLAVSCRAAMLRTHAWESHCDGGVRWRRMAAELKTARADTTRLVRAVHLREWLDAHIPTGVQAVVVRCADQGVHIRAARMALVGDEIGPLRRQDAVKFRRQSQRWFAEHLLKKDGFDVETRLRSRLLRWRLPGFPGRIARRVAVQLARLRQLAPPRVRAAALSTIFNRWVSDRRMRSRRRGTGLCKLQCSATAADSVEHYFRCPVWLEWQRRRLGDCLRDHGLRHGVLAAPMSDGQLCRQAIGNYVLYRGTNHLRRHRFAPRANVQEYIHQHLDQLLHEGTRDSLVLRRYCRLPFPETVGKRTSSLEPIAARRVSARTQ